MSENNLTKRRGAFVNISADAGKYYSYSHHIGGIPAIYRLYIHNGSEEDIFGAELSVSDSAGFFQAFNKKIAILPHGTTIETDVSQLGLSPAKLIAAKQPAIVEVVFSVTFETEKRETLTACTKATVTVLPFNTFCGTAAVPGLISAHITPDRAELGAVSERALAVLRGWKIPRILGYVDGAQHVRRIAAAVYAAMQELRLTRMPGDDRMTQPAAILSAEQVLAAKTATAAEAALLYAAVVEGLGLNVVICLGGGAVLCGVWLRDACLNESAGDDIGIIKKLSDPEIDDLLVLDAAQLFGGSANGFDVAAQSAQQTLASAGAADAYDIIDIKRCRLMRYMPLPRRIKKGKGYAVLVDEPRRAAEALPRDSKKGIRTLKTRPILSRERQWERRLLDLTLRNRLLSTQPGKNALHVMFPSPARLLFEVSGGGAYRVIDMPREGFAKVRETQAFGGVDALRPVSELLSLELKGGRICTYSDPKELAAALSALQKKDKISFEETGTGTLYLAAGFLKWCPADNREGFRYAPLLLMQVSLEKSTAGRGYTLTAREDAYHFNTTLSEFLKREFNIELRGLNDLTPEEADIDSVFAAVKRHILHMKGWEVTQDIYIASYSFSRYLMWNDLRQNMECFRKNKLIDALLNGADSRTFKRVQPVSPDDTRLKRILTPLSADYSQFSAISAAVSGASFVLHGPPGTGKSQTITNIIANAVAAGKRVLFVAEKAAALSVVKKRLDEIGLGDFCLELHSGSVPKTETAARLLRTSQLIPPPAEEDKTQEIIQLKEDMRAVSDALHKKRASGFSVYEAITEYKKYESCPDILDIDESFLEGMTQERFRRYCELLSEFVFVAQDCGQIYRSPLEGITESRGGAEFMSRALTAAKVLKEQARHLKAYAELSLEKLGNNVRVLTGEKLEVLYKLCQLLTAKNSPYSGLFESKEKDPAAVLNDFTQLYKKHEQAKDGIKALFKNAVPELAADPGFMRDELEKYGQSYRKSRALRVLSRRIERTAAENALMSTDMLELMRKIISFYTIKTDMALAGDAISALLSGGKQERVDYDRVAEIVLKLTELYDTAESLFSHYDQAAFNRMLKDLHSDYPCLIFTSYMDAHDAFLAAYERYKKVLRIEDDEVSRDLIAHATDSASALIQNADLLPAWIKFNRIGERLAAAGLSFAVSPLKERKVSAQQVTECFLQRVYHNFLLRETEQDPVLAEFLPAVYSQRIERLKRLLEQGDAAARREIFRAAAARLPRPGASGSAAQQLALLSRAAKSNMRGITLRQLLGDIPDLLRLLCPCMLMSPGSVAQYLPPDTEMFDMVIFDEASQMPTAEAVGSLARASQAVIVGDPKQLPPTAFFISDYIDEDNLKNEDLESILDDALALGLPEKYLVWHYRSRHESLIAFSNTNYYDNKLCTFPSPDALEGKVSLRRVENGVYDRGATKQNIAEADAVVQETVRRLKSRGGGSIGIITFGIAQQALIEARLAVQIARHKLEDVAYTAAEPIFVKNLENVQGDERDIILLSVCYGPDRSGRLSLNFGPLNQAGGWRRLNVAASRARQKMLIFTSMPPEMIDLGKNTSRGVVGLKALMEYAISGKSALAVPTAAVGAGQPELWRYIARDLKNAGIDCQCGVGVSGFKIDVAVYAPGGDKFLLAIICDNTASYAARSVRDTEVLQASMLKRLGWNVMRIFALDYFKNPRREIRKIKQALAKLSGNAPTQGINKFIRDYEFAKLPAQGVTPMYISDERNTEEIAQRLMAIAVAEQPISEQEIIKRCLSSYGITRGGSTAKAAIKRILSSMDIPCETIGGRAYFRNDDSVLSCSFYRADPTGRLKRATEEITPYETVAAARHVLNERISLKLSALTQEIARCLMFGRLTAALEETITEGIEYGIERGILFCSINSDVTLA